MNLKIGIIVGSVRPNRVGNNVGEWFMGQVKDTENIDFDLIDLKDINLPLLNEPDLPAKGNYTNQSTKEWSKKIANYDGFVIVTPEYNHGYSPVLKNAIDTIYSEWAKKPVAFVGYGSLGGVRAVEQLVQVTAQINMVPLPSTQLNIIDIWEAIDENGNVKPEKIKGSTEKLINNLLWWANLLKSARAE